MSDRRKYHIVLDVDVQRKARSRAILEESTFSNAIETLLKAWLSGNVHLSKIRRVANGDDNPSRS